MAVEQLRYVTSRKNRNGSLRWYWQRSGHKLTRLPDDPVQRYALAYKLNADADGGTVGIAEGTFGWAVHKYRASDRYLELKPASKGIYNRWLDEYDGRFGHVPLVGFTRRVVLELRDELQDRPAVQGQAMAVLQSVMRTAHDYGAIPANPALKLGLRKPKPRRQVWSDADFARFFAACDSPTLVLAVQILRYTAQRPIDVAAMTWAQYNGDLIRLRQEKTGVLLDVPCHSALRQVLDATPRRATVIVTQPNGRPVKRSYLTSAFDQLRERAKLTGLQLRDLRRTAVVNLAEAGATVPQIAAVTGHSIEHTAHIVATYLPTNTVMARAAIALLEGTDAGRRV